MSLHAPFIPGNTNNFNLPALSTRKPDKASSINKYFVGHVYSMYSTIPNNYLFWYKKQPNKNLTITGESKNHIMLKFKNAILQSNLGLACKLGVELHCSGYFQEILNIIIEIIGTHVHIHNPNISTRILERYRRFQRQINLPSNAGTIEFPENELFFEKPEILEYQHTLNCQPVRNFLAEIIATITLSHQKEMLLPNVDNKDLNQNYLYVEAVKLNIPKAVVKRDLMKNELKVVLEVIKRCLLHTNAKTEKAIYWILWLIKLEAKIKRKGEKLPCKTLNIEGVPKEHTDHWVWYIWKSLFGRLSHCNDFKKKQIIDIYELFKLDFTKTIVTRRLPLLFFSIQMINYNVSNLLPAILNNLHLHIQVYSNINTLYRNLQIQLARKSWIQMVRQPIQNQNIIQKSTTVTKVKPKKITKKAQQEIEHKRQITSLNKKLEYLDIIPKANNYF